MGPPNPPSTDLVINGCFERSKNQSSGWVRGVKYYCVPRASCFLAPPHTDFPFISPSWGARAVTVDTRKKIGRKVFATPRRNEILVDFAKCACIIDTSIYGLPVIRSRVVMCYALQTIYSSCFGRVTKTGHC